MNAGAFFRAGRDVLDGSARDAPRPLQQVSGAGGFRRRRLVPLLALLVAGGGRVATAQSVRVTGTTSVQTVDLRPLVDDSVLATEAEGTGPYRQLADGRLVRCVDPEPYCRFRRSGDRVTAMPLVQDLQGTAWGFGEGISLHAHVRARASLSGNEFLWPRADDHFDALEAYLQVDREHWRAKLGRQWAANGLGLYNFDGGAVQVRRGRASLEAFGGLSLVQGLNEAPTGGTLGDINDLPPDQRGYLLGVRGAAKLGYGSLAGVYQRVIRADRGGLYSERFSLDGSLRALGTAFDGSFVYDMVAARVNEARVRATRQLPQAISASVDVWRHRPFFETWTIWGAFSPVGFDEARATLGWHSATGRLLVDASGAWRRYEDPSTGLESVPLKNDGWRTGVAGQWTPRRTWTVHADYDIDIGFGASISDASAGVRWTPNERVFVGGVLSALQNIYEFRVGTGRILGIGAEAGATVGRDTRILADAAFYGQRGTNGAPFTDWGQRRVSVRLEWTLGRDAGEDALPPSSAPNGARKGTAP